MTKIKKMKTIANNINSAELDTYRRSLGLSTREVAALCDVKERTVNRWQNGDSPIPNFAMTALDDLSEKMENAVVNALLLIEEKNADGPVLLWRYRNQCDLDNSAHAGGMPLGAHAVMISWCCEALSEEDIDYNVAWAV